MSDNIMPDNLKFTGPTEIESCLHISSNDNIVIVLFFFENVYFGFTVHYVSSSRHVFFF